MKELKHIPRVNKQQAEFCESLGLSVSGDTVHLALAKLHGLIDGRFHDKTDLGRPTDKQIDLAAQFGYDISAHSRQESDAIISDILTELNWESIEEQSLAPGVSVINRCDQLNTKEVISSIQDDGLVFLK